MRDCWVLPLPPVTFPGDHNSRRPPFFYSSVSIFFHNVLQQHATALEGGSKSAPGGIAVGRPNGTAAVYLKPATEVSRCVQKRCGPASAQSSLRHPQTCQTCPPALGTRSPHHGERVETAPLTATWWRRGASGCRRRWRVRPQQPQAEVTQQHAPPPLHPSNFKSCESCRAPPPTWHPHIRPTRKATCRISLRRPLAPLRRCQPMAEPHRRCRRPQRHPQRLLGQRARGVGAATQRSLGGPSVALGPQRVRPRGIPGPRLDGVRSSRAHGPPPRRGA